MKRCTFCSKEVEMLFCTRVDIWMDNHLCEENQIISDYSSTAIKSNSGFYLRPNIEIVRRA